VTETAARCAVYARYSNEKQNPLTVDQQIRKCREFASRHALRILDPHIHADEAISGATDDRPGLRALLAAARETPRPFDVILVDDTSRLSRKQSGASVIVEKLQFLGVRVVFVAQGIDSDSEQAGLLIGVHGIVDSMYLKDLSKRTFRGVEQLALKGLHTGGRVFGYRRVPILSNTQVDSHGRPLIAGVKLEMDPGQAGIVNRIFERYASGFDEAHRDRSQRLRNSLAATAEGKNLTELVSIIHSTHFAQRPLSRLGDLGKDSKGEIARNRKADLQATASK
jgi:DNA invertase Pin-like site-specific DNA recombinase